MADVEALLQEGKKLHEQKRLRGALETLEKAKEQDSENAEVNREISVCQFELKSVEGHFEEGIEAKESGDKPKAYQCYLDMSKLIVFDELTDKEKIFAQEIVERERLRALHTASDYIIRKQYLQAKHVLDEYAAKAGEDEEILHFLDLLKSAPEDDARKRKRSLIAKIVVPVIVILAVVITAWIQRGMDQVQKEQAKQAILQDYLEEAFVPIKSGSFVMGAKEEEGGPEDERPVHEVKIKPFFMAKTETPQLVWELVMGTNPSFAKLEVNPVESVSWDEVQKFIKKLNEIDPGKGYRLPTEAEWEYACRAGTTTKYYNGETLADLEDIAWFNQKENAKVFPIERITPNNWGLYDVLGNVAEWCEDAYHGSYEGASADGSAWLVGEGRVVRGGSIKSNAEDCRSASRMMVEPNAASSDIGFRLAKSTE